MSESENESTDQTTQWFTPLRVGLMIAVLLAAVFPGIVAGTASFFRSDYGVIGYPALAHVSDSARMMKFPLWNHYSNCGVPFFAQWGTMCLYPGNLFFIFLPLPWALGVFCLGHLWLAGLGMYRLAVDWTGNRVAAGFAGIAFTFGGATLSSLIWPNYCVALAWMPWLVFFARRGWREGGRWIPLAALAGCMQMLVGVPELVMLTWILLGVLWLLDRNETTDRRRWLIALPGMVVLVAALSAVQLMPFFDLLDQSQRSPEFRDMRWPMPIWGWANLFVPLFHYGATDDGLFMQQGQYFLSSYYLGLGVITFAFLAVLRQRDKRTWALAGLAIFALIMALGHKGLLYTAVVNLIPGAGIARYPIKFVMLAAFLFPLLAAIGIAHFLKDTEAKNDRRFRDVTTIMVAVVIEVLLLVVLAHAIENPLDKLDVLRKNTAGRLILFGLFFIAFLKGTNPEIADRLRRVYLGLAMLFLGADLATHMPNQNPTVPADAFREFPADQQESRPRFNASLQRAMITPAAEHKLLTSSVTPWEMNIVGKRLAQWSNLNLLESVPKVNGSMTLRQGFQDEIQQALYPRTGEAPAAEGLKDFLGVRWITHPTNVIGWIERSNALPVITAGQRVTVSTQSTNVITHLASTNFSPRDELWITAEAFPFATETYEQVVPTSVTNFILGNDQLQFEINAEAPTVAVIAQSYNRNWRAYVNNEQRPIYRANHAFQAVEVPAGRSFVTLRYVDTPFLKGAAISLFALLACGGWIAWTLRRPRSGSVT